MAQKTEQDVKIQPQEPMPEISLAPFASLNATSQFIHYKEYTQTFYDSLKSLDCSQADNFQGEPLMGQVDKLANEFDSHTLEQLIMAPTPMIKEFGEFLASHIDPASQKFIATCWPPVIPAGSNDYVMCFLVSILHVVQTPTNVLQWMAKCVYPMVFTKENRQFKAICRCKKDGKKPGYWAVLGHDNVFSFHHFNKIEILTDFKGKVDAIEVGKDKISISVKAANKVVANFVPEDPQQVQLWADILKAKQPEKSILQFFTSFQTPAVDQIYKITYDQVVNADALVLRSALFAANVLPSSKEAKDAVDAFLTAFSYGRKVQSMITAIVINDFMQTERDINEIMAADSFTKTLMTVLIKKYIASYKRNFIHKLVEYIDSTGGYGIGTDNVDIAGVEKLVTNVVKFICQSFNLFPPQISYALSIIRAYVSLRTNSQTTIYNVVSQFFLKSYIVPIIYIASHLPVKHPEIFVPLSRLLYVIFSFGELNGEFEKLQPLEKRLEHHLYPLLMEFAVTISSMPVQDVEFEVPKISELARALENIIYGISSNLAKFQEMYTAICNNPVQSIIGSNLAVVLTTQFIHEYDTQVAAIEDLVKKRKTKLIKAENFDDLEGRTIHKVVPIDKDSGKASDPNKKYYKKIIKHVPRV